METAGKRKRSFAAIDRRHQPRSFASPVPHGGGDFVEGSIRRITMKNFLTYDYSEVFPGPNLNMIVGANGTGKSSIVCAICLGLAGKTAVLGRGDKVGLYVKRGCSNGSVEIELCKTDGNLVINREIHVENNQSVWMLNGRHSSQKAVEEAVKALQIQVGNLCQFLPQEKVGEFAKMSKIELLEATEKSVGPPEMYEFHCNLKTFRTREREMENMCKEKANILDKTKKRNEHIKTDVERYYTMRRHLDMIQMLEKKKPWVEYEVARRGVEDVKKEREEVKRRLTAAKEAQAPLLKEIKSVEEKLQAVDQRMKDKTSSIREASQLCKQKRDQLDHRHKQIEDIRQALSLKQTEESDRQKRIINTRRIIADLQAELDSQGSQEDVMPLIEAVNCELRRIQDERAELESKQIDQHRDKDTMAAELRLLHNQLRSLADRMNQKEERLRSRFRDTYTALQWLRRNRNLFTGNVYEPMMLEINVRDARHSKYIESHIPINDLRAFIFQKREDMEIFLTEVRDKQELRVNAAYAPSESFAAKPPSRPIESIRHFGFYSYMRELFDAPEDVMSYLCFQYKINDVPVGTEQTKRMIEKVKETQFRTFYTAEEKYIIKKSSYSHKIVSSNTSLRHPQFLNIVVDAERRRQLEEKIGSIEKNISTIDAKVNDIQQRQSTLRHRDNELRLEKKRLSEVKGKKRQLEQKISTKQDSLRQMEHCGIDLQKEEEETKLKIAAVNSQKVTVVVQFIHHMKMMAKYSMEKVLISMESVTLRATKTKLETDCRDGCTELRTLERAFAQLDQKKSLLVEKCRRLKQKAFEICNMGPQEKSICPELQAAFSQLPDTLDDLDARLNSERAQAEFFTGLSEAVVDDYKRREKEIQNLERELGSRKSELETYRKDISEAKERWLIPLKQLVEQINEKFSAFFRSMECAGEVDLHAENEEEYDKYGIRIRVKFRSNTQLHELTLNHQSGGERSVSTMLYLMALQELNRCPFRVVDEINQGMDPVNERRVFDIVVKTACRGTTSQYFFITPKLLQNLQYAEEMMVLCVHNGPHMLAPNEWNEKAFLRRVRAQS
ncbi:structural maintenance of chromosomes protein 5 [Denticeps clupeoides]|uniref:Structural maintenance of chromosomes protein 5 n=1 Tax=Denticeps clupeoides TaxID=299321 RepID=A0AAY4DUW5_9TELE|nr:structural maintenance of chromosomes protein 5 [Denticeps clupeoides]